jgi:hypothetical protein
MNDITPPDTRFDDRFPRLSAVLLVLSNMVPLAGVLFWGWKAYDVLILFWLENVIYGFINVFRMAALMGLTRQYAGVMLIPFFVVHYGMFTMVHGIFINALFGPQSAGAHADFTSIAPAVSDLIGAPGFAVAALCLFASHAASTMINFIGRGEYKTTDIKQQMFAPYKRVVILHFTVLFGAFGLQLLGSPAYAVAILVVAKAALDLAAHLHEHRPGKGAPPAI